MAGTCVEKLPHDCGSSDGLQTFEEDGKFSGWCFACETYIPNPYEDRGPNYVPEFNQKTPEQIEAELAEIDVYQVVETPTRGLKREALEHYSVRVGLSQLDGKSPSQVYFPFTKDGQRTGYKVRPLAEKRIWSIGDMRGVELFGWAQASVSGSRKLFITEGEYDAIALYQALKDNARGGKWEHLEPAVVSLTSGAGSAAKNMADNLALIRATFQEVVFVFDQDEQGRRALEAAIKVYPTAKSAALPCKDPNECILEGRAKALCNAVLFRAETPKNTRLVWGQDLYAAGREQAQWGLSWPWQGLTKLTRGIRMGETYYLGAGVKMGKSEIVNTIGAHLMIEHNCKVFMAKPEEANRKTVQMVLGKVVGKIFHDPEIEFDYEAYDDAAGKVGDRLCMLSLYQHLGWDSLRSDIMVAVQAGCKAVFIDPITNLTNGVASGLANTQLQEIAQELAAMAKDLDIIVFIFCHLKAPESGDSHERGGHVYSHQFAGSRAMMRSCNLMLGLEGNKDPDLDVEARNMRKLVVLEDREFGAVGTINLYWDKNTSLFNEVRR